MAIRVNPDFEVKGSGMRMGGGPQQFGVDAEQVPGLIGGWPSQDVDLLGFHVFAGSQNLQRGDPHRGAAPDRRTRPQAQPGTSDPVRYVNLGGGFGIPYFPKDEPLDLDRRRRAPGQTC